MFKLLKKSKKVFGKLYRHYCQKLLQQWPMLLIVMVLLGALVFLWPRDATTMFLKKKNWRQLVAIFWFISLYQLMFLYILANQGVAQLSGFPTGLRWGLKGFEQNSAGDVKVLIFTPCVRRETVILAKFSAIFTYFFFINLILLTLPLFFYFLFYLSVWSSLTFLLLNGLGFVLINFLFLTPFLFYYYENYSILLLIVVSVIFGLFYFFLRFIFSYEFIMKYPFLFPLISVPLSGLIGFLFFTLYQKKFLKRDFG